MIRKASTAILLLSCLVVPANSSTYHQVVWEGGQPGTGGHVEQFDPAIGYTLSPFYEFKPGDTVDFGSILLSNFVSFASRAYMYGLANETVDVSFRGPDDPPIAYPNFRDGSCSPQFDDPSSCDWLFTYANQSTLEPLVFTLPADALGIQIAWSDGAVYFPPSIPEPSTWLLMLLGFAGLSVARHRRGIVLN